MKLYTVDTVHVFDIWPSSILPIMQTYVAKDQHRFGASWSVGACHLSPGSGLVEVSEAAVECSSPRHGCHAEVRIALAWPIWPLGCQSCVSVIPASCGFLRSVSVAATSYNNQVTCGCFHHVFAPCFHLFFIVTYCDHILFPPLQAMRQRHSMEAVVGVIMSFGPSHPFEPDFWWVTTQFWTMERHGAARWSAYQQLMFESGSSNDLLLLLAYVGVSDVLFVKLGLDSDKLILFEWLLFR